MPLDGLTLHSIVAELKGQLTGGRVCKIYQPEKDEIVLVVRNNNQDYRLLISASSSNPRIHLTTNVTPNPGVPPMFCMLLRKHLTSGKIVDIVQYKLDRIVDIVISCHNEMRDVVTKVITCEIMGKHSNIFLVSQDKILDCIKHVDLTVSSVRISLPGIPYERPPLKDKLNPLQDQVIDSSQSIVDLYMGTSPLFAREIEFKYSDTKQGLIDQFDKIKNGQFYPCLLYDPKKDRYVDFASYSVTQYGDTYSVHPFPDMNSAVDTYYQDRSLKERIKNRSNHLFKLLNNLIDRAKKKKAILLQTLEDAKNKETYKIYGQLITANIYALQLGMDKAVVTNYYSENQDTISIPLDKRLTPSKNAERYFKRYQKAKNSEIMAKQQLEKNQNELYYLESVLSSIENSLEYKHLETIREELVMGNYIREQKTSKKQKNPKNPKKPECVPIEHQGYQIYVGRNNLENDYITLKIARASDMWFHIKSMPGSHVVVKYQGEPFPEEVLDFAASLAAKNSKAKNAGSALVDYTCVKNVKKPNGAKPGMVIYENYKTAQVKFN